MPLRIFVAHPSALLTDHLPHGDGLVAYGFISELASRGHELHVAAESVDLRRALPPNVHVHRLGAGGQPEPFDRFGFMRRMRRLYRRLARITEFDLVHQLNPVEVGLSLALADAALPVVLGPYVPDWPGFRKPGGRLVRPIVLRLDETIRAEQQRRATTVLLSTPAAATKLAARGRRRPQIREVSPGIDEQAWVPAAHSRPGQDVLFLANLHVRKGILVLLDAFAEIAPRLPGARLLVAGDGPLSATVQQRVAGAPALRRVELLGAVERSRVGALMQACSIFCMPSYAEPFGMTALEAMACAKPVVATDAGGLRHLVPDEGGRKVPPGDAAALAAALRELLLTPTLQRDMGEHNRRTVEERFAWARVVDRLEDAYREAIAAARSADRLRKS